MREGTQILIVFEYKDNMSVGLVIKKVKKELRFHSLIYILLFLIFAMSLFVRVYRTQDLMGFYYDQGRDALTIWDLWHKGKPFLVGPVTGLHGIFLGPLFYYLIAPFYLIGNGNPVYPAVFLSFTTVLAFIPLYVLGWRMHSRLAGLIAVTIGGLSYYLVLAGRWLSNPTPMFLISMLLLWTMWSILKKSEIRNLKSERIGSLWILLALLLGMSLQFESASAVFYIPMAAVFLLWVYFKSRRANNNPLPKWIVICTSGLVFLLTFLPQIVFDFRHDHIILQSFKRILLSEKSFRLSFWQVFEVRLSYVWTVFWSKILPDKRDIVLFFSIIAFYKLFSKYEKLSDAIKLLLIFVGIPIVGYFTFQGNEGNVFDYYMTGYYLPLVLLFSLGLASLIDSYLGKFIVIVFFCIFFVMNFKLTKNYLLQGLEGESQIKLGTELAAVDWVLDRAEQEGNMFNVNLYVPPVIPHSYDYLLEWRGFEKCGDDLCNYDKTYARKPFYTIFENDPINPNRLKAWKEENSTKSTLMEKVVFGGVTAEKRERHD